MNGSHRFSLRGSDSASSGRGKIPELWPMPERAKPCGEHSEEIFFYPRVEPVGSDCATPGYSSQTGIELGRVASTTGVPTTALRARWRSCQIMRAWESIVCACRPHATFSTIQEHHFCSTRIGSQVNNCGQPQPHTSFVILYCCDFACLVAFDPRLASEGHPRLCAGANICQEVARCMLRAHDVQ